MDIWLSHAVVFVCSGLLYKTRPVRDVFIINIKRLLLPYFFFVSILCACQVLVEYYSGKTILLAIKSMYERIDFLDEYSIIFSAIWFLPCLFLVRCLHALVLQFTKRWRDRLIIGILFFLIGSQVRGSLFIDTALSVYIFFMLGHFSFSLGLCKNKVNLSWMFFVVVVYTLIIAFIHPKVDIKHNEYPWFLLLMALPIIYALYQFCLHISTSSIYIVKLIEKCGKRSISLLGFHRPLWLFIYPLCAKLEMPIALIAAFEVCSAIVIILPIHNLLVTYVPILIGRSK